MSNTMGLIDLSMTIRPMWRWPIEKELLKDIASGDPYQVTATKMGMHAFTHIDTPLHIELGRESIETVDLERLCGSTAVIDLTPVSANQEIGADLLIKRGIHVLPGDIVLLKTCWDLSRDYTTKEYWLDAPHLNRDAAQWLSELSLKAVGFDFPQDYVIREIPDRHPSAEEMPTHDLLLRKGILLIEYLCNLDQIKTNRVDLYALPLKISGTDGACARVVAVED
ncbi:MAG: cyclase family protein [Deltaproteobacteria bacterium]|nr:cyclase family protein [Deltaproteobacteria bacterium]